MRDPFFFSRSRSIWYYCTNLNLDFTITYSRPNTSRKFSPANVLSVSKPRIQTHAPAHEDTSVIIHHLRILRWTRAKRPLWLVSSKQQPGRRSRWRPLPTRAHPPVGRARWVWGAPCYPAGRCLPRCEAAAGQPARGRVPRAPDTLLGRFVNSGSGSVPRCRRPDPAIPTSACAPRA
jgi:hypothetical protein